MKGTVKLTTLAGVPRPMVEVRYPVGAFRGHEPDAIADRVRDRIRPGVWDEGGEVAARDGNILWVKAPKDVHLEVLTLLRKLRKGE